MIMMAGMAANSGKVKDLIYKTQTVAVQFECNEIVKLLVLEQIGGEKLPSQDTFADYLRKNMRVPSQSGNTRDLSRDQWGTPYQVDYSDYSIKVSSAGPDKVFETSDDVYSKQKL